MLTQGFRVRNAERTPGNFPFSHQPSSRAAHAALRRPRIERLRCQAQGNNTFDQFMQWGKGLLKKTLAPSPRKRPVRHEPASDQQELQPEEELGDNVAESSADSEQPRPLEADNIMTEASSSQNPEMEDRIADYRHMAMTGREITEDWPPPGTPTWSEWLEAFDASFRGDIHGEFMASRIAEAIAEENYADAAFYKKNLDNFLKDDIVSNFTKGYEAALAAENFEEAARIRDEGAVGLRGWWYMQSSSADNPSHLLRISQLYNKYVLLAYSPQDIALIHGIINTNDLGHNAALGYEPNPSSELFERNSQLMAELHFHEFPVVNGDGSSSEEMKIWSQACALSGTITSDEVLGSLLEDETPRHVAAEDQEDGENQGDGLEAIEQAESAPAEAGSVPPGSISIGLQDESGEAVFHSISLEDLAGRNRQDASASDQEAEEMERVPAQITRFDGDRDRFLLTIAPMSQEAEEEEGESQEASTSGDSESDAEGASIVEITQVDPDKIMKEKKNLIDELNARRTDKGDSNSPAKVLAFKLSIKSGVEDLTKAIKNLRDTGSTEGAADLLRHVLESMRSLKEENGMSPDYSYGLNGTVAYKRLSTEPTTDPFTGLFIGMFGAHGPEIIQLQRAIGEDNRTYVEGTKLTGDTNVPAGQVAFRAAIGAKEATPGYMTYPPELGIRTGYKGKGRVAKANYTDARWVDGALLQFQSKNEFSQGAELGFIYDMGMENRLMILLHRINLDDPTQSLP